MAAGTQGYSFRKLTIAGAGIGAITGLALALVYALAIIGLMLVAILISAVSRSGQPLFLSLVQQIPAIIALYFIGLLIALIPILLSILLGAITGIVIAWLLILVAYLAHNRVSTLTGIVVGVAAALALAFVIHLASFVLSEPSLDLSYWNSGAFILFLAIPTLFYLPAGGWIGWWLSKRIYAHSIVFHH